MPYPPEMLLETASVAPVAACQVWFAPSDIAELIAALALAVTPPALIVSVLPPPGNGVARIVERDATGRDVAS